MTWPTPSQRMRSWLVQELALGDPRAFICLTGITALTDGPPLKAPPAPTHLELLVGELVLRVPLGARDRLGDPAILVRTYAPTAGYTRHTLGDREAARDVRRRRRPRSTPPDVHEPQERGTA